MNSKIFIILRFFSKSKQPSSPKMDPEEIGFEQLAHKVKLSQGWGQMFFACCLLQLSLRTGRPAAWW